MTETDLVEALSKATTELRKARSELHEERRWRRWLIGVLASFGLFLLGFLLVVFFAPGWGLVSVANENRENGDLLVDCTTPSSPGDRHACYERGREQTAQALEAIDTNTACRVQDAINQTLNRLSPDIQPIELVDPNECPDQGDRP